MQVQPVGRTLPGISHHMIDVNGTDIHYVAGGENGPPIVLVHGFPETWWAFHKVIPLLAESHRVFAIDLRGFGDSRHDPSIFDSQTAADDLHGVITRLGVGPVHLVGQDISGGTVFRLATTYPADIQSLTAVEMGLAGLGLEVLADVTHGGAWHIGAITAEGVPDLLFKGREASLLTYLFGSMSAMPEAISQTDVEEFARTYSQVHGWVGATSLYRSMLAEGEALLKIVEDRKLVTPVLAIGAGGGSFTADTMEKASASSIRKVLLKGVGHYVALEAPNKFASELALFIADA